MALRSDHDRSADNTRVHHTTSDQDENGDPWSDSDGYVPNNRPRVLTNLGLTGCVRDLQRQVNDLNTASERFLRIQTEYQNGTRSKIDGIEEQMENFKMDMENSKKGMENSIKRIKNEIIKNEIPNIKNEIIENVITELKNADIDLKKSNRELFEQENALKTTLAEEKHRKQIFDQECAQKRQNMKTEFDRLFTEYKDQLNSIRVQKLKQFDSDILTKQKSLKERNFLKHQVEKSMRDSVESKEAEWKLFLNLRQMVYDAYVNRMTQTELRKSLSKHVRNIYSVLHDQHGYQLQLSRKRVIFQLFYEIVTDKTEEHVMTYKKELIKALTPHGKNFPPNHIMNAIQTPGFINDIINKVDVGPIQLDDDQAKKLEQMIKDYKENVNDNGERPTFHLDQLVLKTSSVFTVIAMIQAVLGLSRVNGDPWYDPNKKILYASPLNPYTLNL